MVWMLSVICHGLDAQRHMSWSGCSASYVMVWMLSVIYHGHGLWCCVVVCVVDINDIVSKCSMLKLFIMFKLLEVTYQTKVCTSHTFHCMFNQVVV
jgi:hypothetical protein